MAAMANSTQKTAGQGPSPTHRSHAPTGPIARAQLHRGNHHAPVLIPFGSLCPTAPLWLTPAERRWPSSRDAEGPTPWTRRRKW
jgi:hypothetical protein